MAPTLELLTGEAVTPEDVFLFNGYPYRFVPTEDDRFAFELSPLYRGGETDVPFPDREHLEAQWAPSPGGRSPGRSGRSGWPVRARTTGSTGPNSRR